MRQRQLSEFHPRSRRESDTLDISQGGVGTLQAVDGRRATWIAAGAALLLAVAIRVHNALQYTLLWGFDAEYNWRYIVRLTNSWVLAAPDAGWSTAHPPFFYYLGAAVCRLLDESSKGFKVVTLRLLVSASGLVIAALAVALVRRTDPGNLRRAVLAGVLVLFLPVHIYMSAMVTEEVLVAALISIALVSAGLRLAGDVRPTLGHAAFLGVMAGLALLTKLTGVLVLFAVAGAFLIAGWRRGELRSAVAPLALMFLLTAAVGGWYYARNLIEYGYLYPHGLEAHKIMFTMPPGERSILDYLRIPLSLWSDPQVLDPGLLRSVWGSTYLTVWFDGHRVFLPRNTQAVSYVGTAILTLAMLPTAAYGIGLLRGGRRAVTAGSSLDTLLVSMVALTLAGYVSFTWQNPWFVTSKGSFLLCLSVPFAYYTSEVLDGWLSRRGWVGVAVWTALGVLLAIVVATFTWSELFWNMDHMWKPGVLW